MCPPGPGSFSQTHFWHSIAFYSYSARRIPSAHHCRGSQEAQTQLPGGGCIDRPRSKACRGGTHVPGPFVAPPSRPLPPCSLSALLAPQHPPLVERGSGNPGDHAPTDRSPCHCDLALLLPFSFIKLAPFSRLFLGGVCTLCPWS